MREDLRLMKACQAVFWLAAPATPSCLSENHVRAVDIS